MAIELKNSLFIHNPKCGGRTAKQMLKKHVKNIQEGIEATKIPEITDGDFLFTI